MKLLTYLLLTGAVSAVQLETKDGWDDWDKAVQIINAGAGLAELGGPDAMVAYACLVAVVNIVSLFTPHNPSPDVLAIRAATKKLVQHMDEEHDETMKGLSQIRGNQFFLQSIDQLSMLRQLSRTMRAFHQKFNKRAVGFICGYKGLQCTSAYRDWMAPFQRRFSQLGSDGAANSWNGSQ